MSIRKYKKSDLSTILDIYALSKLDELAFEQGEFELLPLNDDEKRFPLVMESEIYVYESVGVIAFGAKHENEIRSLYVFPQFRGLGVGKMLLEYMLSEMPGNVTLDVAMSNLYAKRLYFSYGFKEVREFETDYNGKPVLANTLELKKL